MTDLNHKYSRLNSLFSHLDWGDRNYDLFETMESDTEFAAFKQAIADARVEIDSILKSMTNEKALTLDQYNAFFDGGFAAL